MPIALQSQRGMEIYPELILSVLTSLSLQIREPRIQRIIATESMLLDDVKKLKQGEVFAQNMKLDR